MYIEAYFMGKCYLVFDPSELLMKLEYEMIKGWIKDLEKINHEELTKDRINFG